MLKLLKFIPRRRQDLEALEMRQLLEYPSLLIRVNMVNHGMGISGSDVMWFMYDVKYDGHHKSRLVSDGRLTDPSTDSAYSGVVSLCGIQLVTFLSELNGL